MSLARKSIRRLRQPIGVGHTRSHSTPACSTPPPVAMSALGPSFAKTVKNSRGLYSFLKPLADRYASLAGYRKHGLKYDDILIEENQTVQKALGRLSERESYDRAFRLRTAHMCAIAHKELPKDEWVPASEDVRYLKPIVQDLESEIKERSEWDSVKKA
ncbi:Cytochrome b-c1 complex subunit 7 [Microbotryomycetes sp. JL221]|nr:Cytochrome b-c1 complex subunit 7 [Microbotryomycetes sp. JL221]